jgi:hypothetical protein
MHVISIVLDKIVDGYIYSQDGGKFQITLETRVLNNSKTTESKMRTAELFFKENRLVTVIIK